MGSYEWTYKSIKVVNAHDELVVADTYNGLVWEDLSSAEAVDFPGASRVAGA